MECGGSEAPTLFVHSMVRHLRTRGKRAACPARHRFKQYLFGGTRRLVRRRALPITDRELTAHLGELRDKWRAGILEVRTRDGRIVDLDTLEPGPKKEPAPRPRPPLDSIARDPKTGIALPQYPGGAPISDPAAARAAHEIARRSRVDEDAPADDVEEDADDDVSDVEPPEADVAPVAPGSVFEGEGFDPALERQTEVERVREAETGDSDGASGSTGAGEPSSDERVGTPKRKGRKR
jgi:hypothetical protein